MAYLLLAISVDREQVDAVDDLLESAGALAVTLSGAGEDELLEPLPGEQPLWRQVRLQALVDPGVDLAALQASLAPAGARLVDVDFLGEEDWQERWRAYAVRARFGDRLWLLPRDEPFCGADADGAVLRLDPGLAFGSGSHPTTRLCLAGLADQALDGRRVLDFGCGSGILAVAACLLGATAVVAVDHDPQALFATRENATYNSIEPERLRVLRPEELRPGAAPAAGFDVVVANILANPLVELAPVLTGWLAPQGLLMLSGLLAEQEDMIRAAYPQVQFGPPAREAEWIRLDGRRTTA